MKANQLRSVSRPGKESGAEELRRIVAHIENCRESALDPYSAEEILRLARACWASEWDVWIDDLSPEQCAKAIEDPAFVPRFEETKGGLRPIHPDPLYEIRVRVVEPDDWRHDDAIETTLGEFIDDAGDDITDEQRSDIVATIGKGDAFEDRDLWIGGRKIIRLEVVKTSAEEQKT